MRPSLPLALLLAAAASCAPSCAPGEPPRAERIVLLTIDTLRHDALDPQRMPATAAFAARGLRFTRVHAASSSTQPTHATLFTGLHPWQHGVARNGLVLGGERATLAERLAAAGWSTAAVVASFPLERRFGFAQGFASYEDDFTEVAMSEWGGERVEGARFSTLAGTVVDRAVAALDRARGTRQFFWFHLFDPHEPYGDAGGGRPLPMVDLLAAYRARDPGAPRLLERARSLYEEDVAALDRALGRLFDRLARDEDELATHVLFTADHGESFGEGGSLGHGKRLTPEQILVPTFLVSPDVEPGVRDDVAGTADLFATLLAIAGLPRDGVAGRDLRAPPPPVPVAFGMRRTFETPFHEVRTDGRVAVHDRPLFFAARPEGLVTGRPGAVVLEDDPRRPLPPGRSALFAELFATFEDELAGARAEEARDPRSLEALRALGYAR